MEPTTYASRLRYLDARDVDDTAVAYDGLLVVGPDGKRLGDLDGFIVDALAGRVHYVVVDSGGWFRSRRVLIPIGHAALAGDRTALRVDVTHGALSRYPEFDGRRFREFSDEDIRRFEESTAAACCPDELADDTAGAYGARPHFAQPEWWTSASIPQDRLRPVETTGVREAPGRPHEESRDARPFGAGAGDAAEPAGARAQPGDVIGIETSGARTHLRDTAADERRRRRTAERARGDDDDEPRQSER